MYTHKLILLIALLSFQFNSFAQDILYKINGEKIEATITSISSKEINYTNNNTPNSTVTTIKKSQIAKIEFNTNTPKTPKETNLEETKKIIITLFNNHTSTYDSPIKKYHAEFIGKYLKLTPLRKNGKQTNVHNYYDFSDVYEFKHLDKRTHETTFINVWVSLVRNLKHNQFEKNKLTFRVNDRIQAQKLLDALKHFNKLILAKENKSTELK